MTKNERANKINEIIAKNPSAVARNQKATVGTDGRIAYFQTKNGRETLCSFMELCAQWDITDEVRALSRIWRRA